MAGPPPTEILEHIIDSVASNPDASRIYDLLSLCICCKTLVPRSQKHIFRDVTLHPPAKAARADKSIPPHYYSRDYKRTTLFVQTVAKNPHLGQHVQNLTCRFTAQLPSTDDTTAPHAENAFRSMENVRNITLAFTRLNSRLDLGLYSTTSSTWAGAVTSLVQRPHVQHLSVDGVVELPRQVILAQSHLRHLDLCNSGIEPLEHADDFPRLLQHFPHLKSLTCDHQSLSSVIIPVLSHLSPKGELPTSRRSSCSFVSHIEDLDISTGPVGLVALGTLLRQTECLNHLRLTMRCTGDPSCPSLLEDLNSDSFNTLSHLTIRIITSLIGRHAVIRNPYGRPWNGILARMTKLGSFEFSMVFQGEFDVDPSSFGEQWGQLPEIFALGSDKFPCLRKFKTVVHVRLIDDDFREDRDEADAEQFRENIENLVYPRHFLPLRGPQSGKNRVDYSFEVESSTGDEL